MRLTKLVAKGLQEALELSHTDIASTLSDELRDMFPGTWAYVCAVYGDAEDGDVVYCVNNDCKRAPYEIGDVNGKRTCAIDDSQAVDVIGRMVWDEEAEEEDQYANMGEAERGQKYAERFPGSKDWAAPIAERFISKTERDAMDPEDFAGKGKSFPIKNPSDIAAAVKSIGRAGSDNLGPSGIKKRIIAIAKRKGWEKHLPKSWQSGDATESNREASQVDADLTGDIIPLREGAVGQDGTILMKVIQPGWGSSGYYSKELLKRDAAKAFPKGTKSFWNHQTDAEEAARPEGDLRDLASVTTADAYWDEKGPDGAAVYAKGHAFEAFRQPIDDLAKHIGVSIRATGKAREGKAEGRTGPIIEELTRGISIDYVTAPGAGGKVLQLFEAARQRQTKQESQEMTPEELKAAIKEQSAALITEAMKPLQIENTRLKQQLNMITGPNLVREALATIGLPDAAKARIIERLAPNVPMTEAGAVDTAKLKTLVETEATAEAAYLRSMGVGQVQGLGVSVTTAPLTEADKTRLAADEQAELEESADLWGHTGEMGKKIFMVGRGAFKPTYNSAAVNNPSGVLVGVGVTD